MGIASGRSPSSGGLGIVLFLIIFGILGGSNTMILLGVGVLVFGLLFDYIKKK